MNIKQMKFAVPSCTQTKSQAHLRQIKGSRTLDKRVLYAANVGQPVARPPASV